MQLHELKPTYQKKQRKRVGRGGKRGTYSGRGMKGQRSRSGRRLKPAIRSLIKRYPKLRGYRFNPLNNKPVVVNLGTLEKKFPAPGGSAAGGKSKIIINPEILLKRGLIRKIKGKIPPVKILAKGKITKTFEIEGCLFSRQAKEKMKKTNGGTK